MSIEDHISPDEENSDEGSGIFHGDEELPKSRVDFLISTMQKIYGEDYLADQIEKYALSPDTSWYELVELQLNLPDRDRIFEVIGKGLEVALQEASLMSQKFESSLDNLNSNGKYYELKRMRRIAIQKYNLSEDSDYHDVHLKIAFDRYVDNIGYWKELFGR